MFRISIFVIILTVAGMLWYQYEYREPDIQREQATSSDETINGEAGAAPEQLSATTSAQRIVGTWQSIDDPASVVAYTEDGVSYSRYKGEEIDSGTWEIETRDDAAYDPSGVFFITTIDGEEFAYAIVELTDERLTLNYLERGNMLRYSRIEVD